MNLIEEFNRAANQRPNNIALVHQRRRISYQQLGAAVKMAAQELRRAGIEPGQKVGLLFPNGLEHVTMNLAVISIGAVVLFLSPQASS